MRKAITIIVLCISLMSFSGCAAHRVVDAGQPVAPVSTWEQINYDNLQISIHNRTAAKSLVAIHQAGYIDVPTFDKMSAAQIRITRAWDQLTPLLKDAQTAQANSDKVKALLGVISDASVVIINSGVAIKNAQSQQALVSEVNAIKSLASSIYSLLETAGVKL